MNKGMMGERIHLFSETHLDQCQMVMKAEAKNQHSRIHLDQNLKAN